MSRYSDEYKTLVDIFCPSEDGAYRLVSRNTLAVKDISWQPNRPEYSPYLFSPPDHDTAAVFQVGGVFATDMNGDTYPDIILVTETYEPVPSMKMKESEDLSKNFTQTNKDVSVMYYVPGKKNFTASVSTSQIDSAKGTPPGWKEVFEVPRVQRQAY